MNKTDITSLLLSLSSITELDVELGKENPEFKEIQEALYRIHMGKSRFYGDYLSNILKDDPTKTMIIIQLFLEMKRKWTRLNNIVKEISLSPSWEIDQKRVHSLLDTLSDLGVYSVMNIHCLAKTLGVAEFESTQPLPLPFDYDEEVFGTNLEIEEKIKG
jgi:hypothetical protein